MCGYSEIIVLCLGSNLGSRELYIEKMERALENVLAAPVIKSRLMETAPVDVTTGQEWYLNRIISGFYSGTPQELLVQTQLIERNLGRTEKGARQARTADIDILLFGNVVINTIDLVIPHRGLCSRRFCIEGLKDCLPDYNIAALNTTVNDLYNSMDTQVKAQCVRWL